MERIYASALMGFAMEDEHSLTSDQQAELDACARSFTHFLRYWRFKNRETGAVMAFETLWPGQQQFAELIEREPWILALKAGKLGFTELECAYDGWVALFRQPNARIHLFSRDAPAAQELLGYVRFGLTHLPDWMKLPILADSSGGDTVRSLKLEAGPDDVRSIVSYAAGTHAGIDQSATHSHVDELAHMPFPERTWSSIQTTVVPGGSCHIVTRGSGDDNYVAELWESAQDGASKLAPFFAPWSARPDRDRVWREEQAGSLPNQGLLHFAPESADDALAGADTAIYIPAEVWDQCHDPDLPPLQPGDRTDIVVGIDASVRGDLFAVVAVSRHPQRHGDAAIRACKAWTPGDHGGRIDFDEVERFLRFLAQGGCPGFHPKSMPDPLCRYCAAGDFPVAPHNVVQMTYDLYQMEDMAQRLRRAGIWCKEFPQGTDRLIADSKLHQLALRRALAHNGDPRLREHVLNARAKLSREEDSKMRIVKRVAHRKIDLVVAASMAVHRVLRLNI